MRLWVIDTGSIIEIRRGVLKVVRRFGVGMVLAGGCGAGSIWRMGEGQVKLWVAVATFALSASLARLALTQTGLQAKLGVAVFMPSIFGWAGAVGLVVAVMLAWAALATWNEASGKFSAM